MYILRIRDVKTDKVTELEFVTRRLAVVYRDYHLAFGNWNNQSRWIEESVITPEERAFACDEITEIRDGQIVRIYQVTDGIKLEIEKATSKDIVEQSWYDLRCKRDVFLRQTDWTQLSDVVMQQEDRKLYRAYRAYLRGLPKLHNDETIVTAEVYDFTEWLNGKR